MESLSLSDEIIQELSLSAVGRMRALTLLSEMLPSVAELVAMSDDRGLQLLEASLPVEGLADDLFLELESLFDLVAQEPSEGEPRPVLDLQAELPCGTSKSNSSFESCERSAVLLDDLQGEPTACSPLVYDGQDLVSF